MEEIRSDQEIQTINNQVVEVEPKIFSLEIRDEHSEHMASTYLGLATKAIKTLEEKRVRYTKGLLEQKKVIDNDFKSMEQRWYKIVDNLGEKILAYKKYLREEAAKKDNKVNEIARDLGVTPIEKPIENKPTPVRTVAGIVFTQKRWTWKLVDETKIPREYLMIDEKKINALIRANAKTVAGVSSCNLKIDGIEIFQTESLAART